MHSLTRVKRVENRYTERKLGAKNKKGRYLCLYPPPSVSHFLLVSCVTFGLRITGKLQNINNINPTLSHLQALEETKMNQVRIITELEKEKKKMQDDVQKLKDAKVNTHLNIA